MAHNLFHASHKELSYMQFSADCMHVFGMHSEKKASLQSTSIKVDSNNVANKSHRKGSNNKEEKKSKIWLVEVQVRMQKEEIGRVKSTQGVNSHVLTKAICKAVSSAQDSARKNKLFSFQKRSSLGKPFSASQDHHNYQQVKMAQLTLT